jgi:hypothetical protein
MSGTKEPAGFFYSTSFLFLSGVEVDGGDGGFGNLTVKGRLGWESWAASGGGGVTGWHGHVHPERIRRCGRLVWMTPACVWTAEAEGNG